MTALPPPQPAIRREPSHAAASATPGNEPVDHEQAAQLPGLAERSPDTIERVAEILVEARSVSAGWLPSEIRGDLSSRLQQAGIQLPSAELDELVAQLMPSAEDRARG